MDITLDELEKKSEDYANCLQANFAYLFNKNGDKLDNANALGLGISFRDNKFAYLGGKIFPNITYNFLDFYREEFGYEIKVHNHISEELIHGILLEEKDCLIRFDAYYSSWSPAFSEVHIFHYALVETIDTDSGQLIIRDPYIREGLFVSDIDTIFKGITHIYSIEKVAAGNAENKTSLEHLCELAVYGKSVEQTEESYKRVIEEFSKVKDISELFEKKASSSNPLIVLTNQVENNHYALMYVLWKQAKDEGKEEVILPLLEKVEQLTNNWGRIKLIIAKLNIIYRIKEKNIQQIINILNEQLEIETDVVKKIYKLIDAENLQERYRC